MTKLEIDRSRRRLNFTDCTPEKAAISGLTADENCAQKEEIEGSLIAD